MNSGKYLDANGISYLYHIFSLQDYPNNDTLATILNAIDNTKADKNFETWTFVLEDNSTIEKKVNISD